MTTNLRFGDWTQVFGDEQLTAALLDRLTHHAHMLDGAFCLEALQRALKHGKPEIFNTDQGAQFTAHAFTGTLKDA